MMREAAPPLSVSEALAAALVSVLSAIVVTGYLWGMVARILPYAVLGFAVATAVVLCLWLLRRAHRERADVFAAAVVFAGVLGWILYLGWPSLLPPGGGPDLAHHLTLVEYLDRRWQLPDGSLAGVMNEMAHYTPGVHLLAVLAGAWTRTDGLHALYSVMAVSVALKCLLVYAIAMRSLPSPGLRVPFAVGAVALCLLPAQYFLGSFAHDSFFAQAAAETFAVAMWWAVVVWDAQPARLPLVLFAIAGCGAFLTWPLWIGAPMVTLAAVALTREGLRPRQRLAAIVLASAAPLAIAALHTVGRTGWLVIAGTSGGVLRPSIEVFGWPFAVTAATGLAASVFSRETRSTLLLTLAIAAQSLSLYALARSGGANTPYMALKMMYLIVYPLAVLGAVAVARLVSWRATGATAWRPAVACGLVLLAIASARTPLARAVRAAPAVSSNLYTAGRWARANVEAACVDYLVPQADTMYWLHLAVLGNPRVSSRTGNPNTFVPARAVARWIEPGGLPYAIAHLPALPKEVLNDVDIVEQFGDAAVVLRHGPSFCADAQRYAFRTGR